MIGIKDIITAINKLLNENYPDIEIQSTDIKEGYARPCFYVEMDGEKSTKYNKFNTEKTVSIRIYYFPSDDNHARIENLEMQDKLSDLFGDGVWITPSFFMPTFQQDGEDAGLDFTIVDDVLQLQFYLYSIQELPDTDNSEPLENLHQNMEREEW